MRWVSSSWTRNTSPTGICAVFDHSRAPVEASVSCVVTRTLAAGAQQRAGHDRRRRPLRAATCFGSAAAPTKRAAALLERTTSDSSPASEAVSASGRLKARNSVSGSGRSIVNGSTISRVTLRGLRGADRLHRHQEPVAAPRQGLDEPRRVGRIPERLAHLTDAEVQALLEVDERVAGPDVLADLAAVSPLRPRGGPGVRAL